MTISRRKIATMKNFSKCIVQISNWKTTNTVKKTPLMSKKLRNEKKICLIFQSAFLNFSNAQYIFADPDCL